MTGTIRVGIGGWTFPPWRGIFYPEGLAQKRELEYASRHLTSIEINGTYYGSQKPESFARWREETPEGFVFALKGPRFTTNRRILAEAEPSIERFFASGVLNLQEKLGPINWQLLPTKRFDPADFRSFSQAAAEDHRRTQNFACCRGSARRISNRGVRRFVACLQNRRGPHGQRRVSAYSRCHVAVRLHSPAEVIGRGGVQLPCGGA